MKEKVGIGIIGAGFARRVQIPAFLACENADIVSVSSRTIANARATAAEFGIAALHRHWRETVEHDAVDLVCITTPPNLHKEMALFALGCDKHILAEKPMAMNLAEAEEMAAAATKAGVLALIDHELRFLPGRLKAKGMLKKGAIGKVKHAKYLFQAPHRGDPTQPWDWWSDITFGGGALGAINSHVIDSLIWFLGTEISSVICQLHTHVKQRPFGEGFKDVTTDDEANMLLRFADGDLTEDATGLVSVSMIEGPTYLNQIEFVGSDGWMRVGHRGDIFVAKRGESEWSAVEVEYPPSIDGIFESGFPSGFMAFAPKIVEAIMTGNHSIEHAATFADGVTIQKVLDGARESNATHKEISISQVND